MLINLSVFKPLLVLFLLFACCNVKAQLKSFPQKPSTNFALGTDILSTGRLLKTNLLIQEHLVFDKEIKDKQIDSQNEDLRFNRNVNTFLGILTAFLFGIAVFVYFTQQRTARLNKIVSEQKEALERLGLVKDRIFSVVSHDMRSPINSLISFTQLLEDGDLTPAQLKRYAANLKNALGYTSSMMENLLNWASSQMQGYTPLVEKFDSQLCAQEVINTMQTASAQKDITVENKVSSGLLCLADLNMTSLVLRNLLNNAIKFTPTKGHIVIDMQANEAHLMFKIIDNGVGLSIDQVNRINADSYNEMGKTTLGTNNERGTGIGLVLCKTFTSIMKGKLSVESKVGEGSVFTLSLPRATSV